jgi:undecaprenyl-diphosphatase
MTQTIPPDEPGSGAVDSPRLLSAALLIGLLAAAVALLIFSWLGREIVAGPTPAADDFLRNAIRERASPGLTTLMIAASRYGGPSWLFPAGAALAIAFFLRGWPRGGLLILVTMAGAGLLNTLLKQSFARPRPSAFFDYATPLSHSFPSGHAFFAASFFGGLAVLLTDRIQSRGLQVAVWVVAISLILLVGFSRVYLGVHYPSDVLAGYAAAVVWVAAVALGDRLVLHHRRRRLL